MDTKTTVLLHKLRNPYGLSEMELRETRHAAACKIEQLIDAYKNMRDFAESSGLDTATRG